MKDYLNYRDKICVVTGAASGMGRATCEYLLDLGAQVYSLDVAGISLPVTKAIQADIGDKDSIDAAFRQIPAKIDRFFGIAGVSGVVTDFPTTIRINFIGHKYITDTYLTARVPEGGAIAFMGSLGGAGWRETREEYAPIAEAQGWDAMLDELGKIAQAVSANKDYGKKEGLQGYFMSKRLLTWYTKKMTAYFADRRIRINIICPGSTQTQLTDQWSSLLDAKAMQGDKEARYAQPEEMAGPIIFANSDMASYMSGTDIYIDYGQTGIRDYENPDRKAPYISR